MHAVIATRLHHLSPHSRTLDAFQHQFHIAHALADRVGMSRALEHQGMVHLDRQDYSAAESALTRALDEATVIGDRLAIGCAIGYLAALDHAQGNFSRAMDRFLRQLTVMQELNARRGLELALHKMGLVYQDAGDHARALVCYHAGLGLGIESKDYSTISARVESMGIAHMESGDERKAEILFRQWDALGRTEDTSFPLAEHLYNCALFNYRIRRYPEALELYAEAFDPAQPIGRPDIALRSLVLACLLEPAQGKNDKRAAVQKLGHMLREWKQEDAQAELY